MTLKTTTSTPAAATPITGGQLLVLKGDLGIDQINNTADASKPVSTAQAAAIAAAQSAAAADATAKANTAQTAAIAAAAADATAKANTAQSTAIAAASADATSKANAAAAASVPLVQKGAANGVATLDAVAKIPLAQLPADVATSIASMTSAASAATAGELADFQAAAGMAGLPQYAISGATSITRADHCNRVGVNSTASNYTLTIQTDALGGYTGNEIVYGFQGSTGTVTIAASDATLRTPTGGKTVTASQGDFVSAQRIGVDTWAITSISASGGGGGASNYVAYALAAPVDYTLTATTTDVPGVSITIPASTWKTGGLLRATVLTRHTGGTTAYNARLRFGSTSIRASLGVNAGNNNVYFSHAEVYNLGSSAQMSTGATGGAAAEVTNGTPSTYTFNTAADLTLTLALDGNAGDVVKVVGLTVEIINPV